MTYMLAQCRCRPNEKGMSTAITSPYQSLFREPLCFPLLFLCC